MDATACTAKAIETTFQIIMEEREPKLCKTEDKFSF